MTIKVGDKIPNMKFKVRQGGDPKDMTTDELFKGKKVVLFAVPGAFTPTCSMKHLPGFIQKYDELKKKGVDTVACLSVNDHFVMGAWAKDQGAGDKIAMIADGNGDFTRAVGLDVGRQRLRPRRAVAAVCDDRRRRRRETAQRREGRRVRGVQRGSDPRGAVTRGQGSGTGDQKS